PPRRLRRRLREQERLPLLQVRRLSRSKTLVELRGTTGGHFEKVINGLQISLPIGRKRLAVGSAGDDQNLLHRARRTAIHPFRKRWRHSSIGAAGDKKDWHVELVNGGLHVSVIRVETGPISRDGDDKVRDRERRQAEQ